MSSYLGISYLFLLNFKLSRNIPSVFVKFHGGVACQVGWRARWWAGSGGGQGEEAGWLVGGGLRGMNLGSK